MFSNSPTEYLGDLYQNRIFVKREDKLPLSFGGNKVRFAEAFLEDMQKKGKTALIAYGSKNSNLCRVLSQLCTDRGVPCSAVYSEEEQSQTNNSKIVNALGVREYVCAKSNVADTVSKAISDFEAQNEKPYYIYGDIYGKGNELTPLSSYTVVIDEILNFENKNNIRFDIIFIAVGTASSYSGLLARCEELSIKKQILGISVARPQSRCSEIVSENLKEYLGRDSDAAIDITDNYLSGGYGKASKAELEEIDFIYKSFNLPLDPTYTGKAWYGMKEELGRRNIRNKNILFIHTGGYPIFCDYKGIDLTS